MSEPPSETVNTIEEASRLLQEAAKHPFLVGIDGGGGSGKSRVAQELLRRHPEISLIEVDDFYRPKDETEFWTMSPREGYERYFEWERLKDQVLEPLSNGLVANYQVYDWPSNSLKQWRRVVSPTVAMVEGCYTLRPELREYFNLKIWVDAPAEVRFQRMIARGHGNDHLIPAWMAAEEWYFKHIQPMRYADLSIRTVE